MGGAVCVLPWMVGWKAAGGNHPNVSSVFIFIYFCLQDRSRTRLIWRDPPADGQMGKEGEERRPQFYLN